MVKVKEDEMSRVCDIHRSERIFIQGFGGKN
jgi:hypothetical protein